MAASSLGNVKKIITNSEQSACKAFADRILEMDTAAEVRAALEEFRKPVTV